MAIDKFKIKKIAALEILDSRGIPTISVKVELSGGIKACAMVPSGTSSGKNEAFELRDGDEKRYFGKGVLKAVANVEKIIFPKLKGRKVTDQQALDDLMRALDGTPNKSRLGANAILGVSLACARAASYASSLSLYRYLRKISKIKTEKVFRLPVPMFNLIEGGLHAESGMDVQEFMFVPKATTFREAVRYASQTFAQLKKVLMQRKLEANVGMEGGYSPSFSKSKEAIEVLWQTAKSAGVPEDKIGFALDVASSGLYAEQKDRRYVFRREKASFSREQLIGWYAELIERYPIVSIEDGLEEEDWEGWTVMNKKIGGKVMVVGDDFTVTDSKRLARAISENCLNALIVKPNQIGTLSEVFETIRLAKNNGVKVVISHRSGETTDPFIADLAVAVNAEFIKTGSVSRGERVVKYNRLMEIETELKNQKSK